MRYLLDTNILSDLIRNPGGEAARHVRRVGGDAVCTSIVVAAELRYNTARKGSPRLRQRVEALLADPPVLPLDVPADAEYGGIRAELEAAGQPIGGNDLLAAPARVAGERGVGAHRQSPARPARLCQCHQLGNGPRWTARRSRQKATVS